MSKSEKEVRHTRSHSNDCEKIKNLKVKNLCVEKATIKSENVGDLVAQTADIRNATLEILNGTDYNCFFNQPTIRNIKGFDCRDCDGNPIKPDGIRQDIWDFLLCNMEAYRVQLKKDFQNGRDQIRCIKKAYGCAPECPPDCPPKSGCTGGCPDLPNCTVDANCIPDPSTCVQDIENNVYATRTILPFSSEQCGISTKPRIFRPNSFTYALNVNNVSCSLATRVASVLVQYAFISNGSTGQTGQTGTTGSTGSACPVCPGNTGSAISCLCDLIAPEIVCGIIDIGCQQYGATININIGEKFTGTVQIPSDIIDVIYELSPNDASIGALQLVIFVEDDLQVFNNTSLRGDGGSGRSDGCGVSESS